MQPPDSLQGRLELNRTGSDDLQLFHAVLAVTTKLNAQAQVPGDAAAKQGLHVMGPLLWRSTPCFDLAFGRARSLWWQYHNSTGILMHSESLKFYQAQISNVKKCQTNSPPRALRPGQRPF